MTRFRLEGRRWWVSAEYPGETCEVRLLVTYDNGKRYGDPFIVKVITDVCKPGTLIGNM